MVCTECKKPFEYFQGEKEEYEKRNFSPPTNCPSCRQKRREAFRNERNIHYNKSALSGKRILALYSEESPFKVIDQDEWWSDDFDAEKYERDFDFNRPFFEQFKELQKDVPRWARIFWSCENSDFVNNVTNAKNCYLVFSGWDIEDCYHSTRISYSNDCVNMLRSVRCQYSSNCRTCGICYNVHFSQIAIDCSDSYFLYDCRGCKDCIMCAGLRGKKYMIKNEQYSKEQYEKHKEEFVEKMKIDIEKIKQEFKEFLYEVPHRNSYNMKMENSTGDYLYSTKNVLNSFNLIGCEDCINLYTGERNKNCYDCFSVDLHELCFECDTSYDLYDCQFCSYLVGCKNCQYSGQCANSEYLFGCIGMKRRKYMILNKQYSKEQYFEMLEKIKEHMKKTGEYGKPFPIQLSSFPYNQTIAHEQYPLTEKEAEELGLFWQKEEENSFSGKKYDIPKNPDKSICDKVLICERTGKPYKILPKEYALYKKLNLPIPRISPDERYKELLKTINSTVLRDVDCYKCGKKVQTAYKEKFNYKIYCEKCFLELVY